MSREIYVSTDIEADGPIPGPHSMLSFGSVAFSHDGVEVSAFSRNLVTLPGASGAPDTMAWWANQKEAWDACRKDLVEPAVALVDYVAWVEALPGKPVFVGYPVCFDFLFVHWYLHRFVGRSPFSHSALDMKTLAMALLGAPHRYRDATKRNMPRRWFPPKLGHTHIALDDAREQGRIFLSMLEQLRAGSPKR